MAVKAAGPTVRNVLESLNDSVNRFIEDEMFAATDASVNPHIEAARDVGLAVGNAINAYDYQEYLKLLADTIEGKVKMQLNELKSMVGDLQKKNSTDVLDLPGRGGRFIEGLPLEKWQPKLTGIFPRYAFVKENRFKVSFTGAFLHAAKYGCELTRISKICDNATPNALDFEVKINYSDEFRETIWNKRRLMKVELKVYYQAGTLLNSLRRATYDAWVGMNPLRPGKITVFYPKLKIQNTLRQNFRSMTLSLHRKDFPEKTLVEKEVTIRPTPGWQLTDYPTPLRWLNGFSSSIPRDQYGPDHVRLKLRLRAEQDLEEAYVTFEETKDVTIEEECSLPVKLEWGESFHFNDSPKFRIELESFDRKKIVINGADNTQPYLQVIKLDDGSFNLVAVVPK